jgi:hypothetical protein
MTARWGKVDHDVAAGALAASVTIAVLLTALILFAGWFYAPSERKEIVAKLRGTAVPIWNSRPAQRPARERSITAEGTQLPPT